MYGAYLRAARERAGLTRSDLAERIGLTSSQIGKAELDKTSLSLQKLDEAAEVMGLRVGDLLPNSGAGPVNDRFEPLMAAMFGLADAEVDELILNLAAQARILSGWRRRDRSIAAAIVNDARAVALSGMPAAQPPPSLPSVTPYTGVPYTDEHVGSTSENRQQAEEGRVKHKLRRQAR